MDDCATRRIDEEKRRERIWKSSVHTVVKIVSYNTQAQNASITISCETRDYRGVTVTTLGVKEEVRPQAATGKVL